MKNKLFISAVAIVITFGSFIFASAAPSVNFLGNNASTTPSTGGISTTYLCLTGDTCRTSWPSAGSSVLQQTDATTLEATTTNAGLGLKLDYFIATSTTATSTFAGGLAVQTNKLVVDSTTGFVGLGTASPAYTLDVDGGTTAQVANFTADSSTVTVRYNNSHAYSTGNAVSFQARLNTDSQNRPATSIVSSFTDVADATRTSQVQIQTIQSGGSLAAALSVVGTNVGIGDTTPASMFTVGNGDKFQISSAGKVGILTSPPSSASLAVQRTTNGGPTLLMLDSGGGNTSLFGIDGSGNGEWWLYNASHNPTIKLFGASSPSFIDTGQNFGIGDQTPAALLTVGSGDLFQVNSSGAIAAVTGITSSGVLNLTSASNSYFTGGGNVGVGTTSPYRLLSIGGDVVVGASTAGGTRGDLYLPKLGTAAGTFLAADATGKVIATSSPSGSGTVTSVGGTGTVNGLTLTGTVTSSGNLTLGGTLAINNADWSGTDLSVANGGTGLSTFGGTNQILYTTAADTLASEAAFTYNESTNLLTTTSASTTNMTIDDAGYLHIPTAANPTIDSAHSIGINNTTASSSVRYYDGTAERALYDTVEKSFTIASSTWLAAKGATASSTIPLGVASSHGETWVDGTCYTDSGGTAQVEFGDGTNWMNYQSLTTTAATQTYSSNNSFTIREKRYVRVGQTASNPDYITCSARIRIAAD